jgi:hypothetical protein
MLVGLGEAPKGSVRRAYHDFRHESVATSYLSHASRARGGWRGHVRTLIRGTADPLESDALDGSPRSVDDTRIERLRPSESCKTR